MAEASQQPPEPRPEELLEFDFTNRHSEKSKEKAKDEQLRDNPEHLYRNNTKQGHLGSISFYTEHREEWITTILEYYPEAVRETTQSGGTKINLGKGCGSNMVFESGRFVILGRHNVALFKERFGAMKRDVKIRVNNTETANDDDDEEAPQSSTDPRPKLARRFDYTNVEDTKEARDEAKDKQLRDNPDILYEHTKKTGYICSLIFYTEHREAWKDTILEYYPGASMGETQEKVSLIDLGKDHLGNDHLGKDHLGKDHLGKDHLGKDHLGKDHLGKHRGTILMFESGKFLINGNCDVELFKQQFEDMKRDAMDGEEGEEEE